eukprot:SM000016S01830  [mRNA]  locus=s16:99239:101408:+ [translate_table: standard]
MAARRGRSRLTSRSTAAAVVPAAAAAAAPGVDEAEARRRALCRTAVERGSPGLRGPTWHCPGCGVTLEGKKEERQHAYRTNLWLRKHGLMDGLLRRRPRQESGTTGAAGSAGGDKGDTIRPDLVASKSAADGREGEVLPTGKKKLTKLTKRGRRGGVMHARKLPCIDWERGSCTRGTKCKYIHNNATGMQQAEESKVPRRAKLKVPESVNSRDVGQAKGVVLIRSQPDDLNKFHSGLIEGEHMRKRRKMPKKIGVEAALRSAREQGAASGAQEGNAVELGKEQDSERNVRNCQSHQSPDDGQHSMKGSSVVTDHGKLDLADEIPLDGVLSGLHYEGDARKRDLREELAELSRIRRARMKQVKGTAVHS